MFNTNKNSQKGISLYLSIMILTILMIIVFGMSTILLSEINVMVGMGRSVIAFFAAESGVEEALLANRDDFTEGSSGEVFLNNGAAYEFTVFAPAAGDCPVGVSYCIKSVGSYLGANRAIWVTR